MRYDMRTALLDCIVLVLILALFSILGCGGGSGSAGTGEQAVQTEQVEQATQAEQVDNPASGTLPSSVPTDPPQASSDPAEIITVAVPAMIGLSFEEASAVLGGLGLVVTSGQDYSEKTAAGAICDQDPSAGSAASPGSPVFIVVSQGTAWVTCSYCGGTGTVLEQYTCPECGGTGLCDS